MIDRLSAVLLVLSVICAAQDRPNILWITSEDNSPWLGCYGDALAETPNLDSLADQGVLYENAFANAPVCAPARCTIATGVYPPSMGTQHMRSKNRVPGHIRFLSQYLRDAGYYCTNNSKTDYNRNAPKGLWDQSNRKAHWRKRKAGQPFFAVFNFNITHESKLHKLKPPTRDPKAMQLAPYHPDLPAIRRDYAQYYDQITAMDKQVGKVLAQLEADGLADNTIVFYYADHGGILTRSKRFLFDSGTHVPMIVRFGKKWQHLAPQKAGSRTDRCVSFVDLAPTALSLAGIAAPDHMEGHAFLGSKQKTEQEQVFLFRGRMDERYDMVRGVRTKRFLYLRNYNPHRIYGQHLDYLWRMRTTTAWEQAYRDGKCDAAQRRFWEQKPTEELYNVVADPHQIHNLAEDSNYAAQLQDLRSRMRHHQLAIRDSGFLPEGMMLDRAAGGTIHDYVHSEGYDLPRILETAELATDRSNSNIDELLRRTKDPDSAVRYWAVTGALIHHRAAKVGITALLERLEDESGDVRIVAAEALCRLGQTEPAIAALAQVMQDSSNSRIVLRAINTATVLSEQALPLAKALQSLRSHPDKYLVRSSQHALEMLQK